MNSINKNRAIFLVAFFVVTIMWIGCTDDGKNMELDLPSGTRIILSVDNFNDVETRSAASPKECTLRDAYLLVFDKSTGKYKAGERVDLATKWVNNGSQTQTLTPAVSIANGDTVVVLGNTYCTFSTIPLTVGSSTIDDINTAFPSTAWGFDGDGDGEGLPMSGTMVFGSNPECKMKHSVAKIELLFGDNLATNDVTGAFYWGNKGLNFGLYYVLDPTKGCIYAPADISTCVIPSGIASSDFQQVAYDNPANTGLQEHSCFYAVEYLCATKAKLNTVDDTRFAPERTGIGIKAGNNNFYRIDLYDHTNGKYLDIRRNCHYKIIINKVKSKGYSTLPEAFENPASNIEYDIVVTGEGDNLIASNGAYGLAMSNDDMILFAPAGEYEVATAKYVLPVEMSSLSSGTTNKITIPVTTGVTLGTASIANIETPIKLNFSDNEEKEVTITLKLGNIEKILHVKRFPAKYPYSSSFVVTGSFLKWTTNTFECVAVDNSNGTVTITIPENVTSETRVAEGFVFTPNNTYKRTRVYIYQLSAPAPM